jgi:taurine dioxygenase
MNTHHSPQQGEATVTTVIDHTEEREAWPSLHVGTRGIEIVPLTATIGAELRNVSLAEASRDAALFAELEDLLLKYKVLFVRDQDITRAEHVALAERFGPLEDHPVNGSDPDHPGLVRIYKDLDSPPEHYENAFHCDATWREVPPLGSVLRCIEGPAVGGDTIWVNMAEAYRRLPAGVKAKIAGLRARHSIEASFGAAMPAEQRRALHARFPDAEHPVVRTHPLTGEEILFVNAFTTHFVNYHTPENVRFGFDYAPGASELLNYLIRQAAVPEFQVRWRWTPNSFAIWDNRCTQHYAVQDYWPGVRKMERAGIVGGHV